MGAATPYSSDEKVTMAFIAFLEEMIADIGLPNRLRDVGIPESSLDGLAKDALNQERLLMNNPRKMSFDDALSIYQAVY
jgi:alcohol dehydrogenase